MCAAPIGRQKIVAASIVCMRRSRPTSAVAYCILDSRQSTHALVLYSTLLDRTGRSYYRIIACQSRAVDASTLCVKDRSGHCSLVPYSVNFLSLPSPSCALPFPSTKLDWLDSSEGRGRARTQARVERRARQADKTKKASPAHPSQNTHPPPSSSWSSSSSPKKHQQRLCLLPSTDSHICVLLSSYWTLLTGYSSCFL